MKNIIIGLKFFVIITLLTGLLYPLLILAIGQVCFNENSNGRSDLIGQKFDQAKYFWARPSAVDYNPLPSGGSNFSATSKVLSDQIAKRKGQTVPADLLYASGSGLDPHLSPAAALFQVDRIVAARQLDSSKKDEIISLIGRLTEGRQFGFFGVPRINVLKLNIELDKIR